MTDAYRQKLLDWLTSMGMLILFTNLFMAAYWFFDRPDVRVRTYDMDGIASAPLDWSIIDWAGPMGELLALYVPGFMVLALWHLFDLVQMRPAREYPATLFASYAPLILLFTILGMLLVLMASGEFLHTVCAKNPDGSDMIFGFDTCQTLISPWLTWPAWIAMLLLVALTLGKGAIAIKSRFTKAP